MSKNENNHNGCYDSDIQDSLGNTVLAMSYVKRQDWKKVYTSEAGLAKGTIFPELEKPFMGQGGCSR